MITLPASVQRTNDIETARVRLSNFIMRRVNQITRVTGINYEESIDAPSTYEEVRAEFSQAITLNKPVRVYSGASDDTIYTHPSVNWAFRFWHDYIHFTRELDFSTRDEVLVGEVQCAEVAAEFGLGSLEYLLMREDTIGQVEYFAHYGEFIANQREYVMQKLAA